MSDGLSNEELLKIVNDITTRISNNEKIDKNEYTEFKERYTHLYEMITSDNFDKNNFIKMLEMRQKVLSGEKDIKSSSEEISTQFFKKYHPDLH